MQVFVCQAFNFSKCPLGRSRDELIELPTCNKEIMLRIAYGKILRKKLAEFKLIREKGEYIVIQFDEDNKQKLEFIQSNKKPVFD